MKRILLLCFALFSSGCSEKIGTMDEMRSSNPTGPYFGQREVGIRPELFSPGFLCTGLDEREPSWAPDGKSVFFWVILPGHTAILTSHQEAGRWVPPEVASFSGISSDFEPCFSPDEQKVLFCSDRPMPGCDEQNDTNIWVTVRREGGWGDPYPLDRRINTDRVEFFPSLSSNGTLYFNRANADFSKTTVYRARFVNGSYAEPEPLPDVINAGNRGSNVFVSADESYLLMPRPGPGAQIELHVSFQIQDATWTQPVPLNAEMPPMDTDDGARVSPDGRFIFFSATHYPRAGGIWGKPESLNRPEGLTMETLQVFHGSPQNGGKDIYWISSGVIEDLRPEPLR